MSFIEFIIIVIFMFISNILTVKLEIKQNKHLFYDLHRQEVYDYLHMDKEFWCDDKDNI